MMSKHEFIDYLETASGPLDELPELTEEGHPDLYKIVEEATREYKAGECEEWFQSPAQDGETVR